QCPSSATPSARRSSWPSTCYSVPRRTPSVRHDRRQGATRQVALGGAFLQDPRARGGGHRRRQGERERGAAETGQAGPARRPGGHPPAPLRAPGGGARGGGAARAGRGRGAVVRGNRGERL